MANKEFNDVQLDVQFTQASARANITSEENISLSFGKLSKWYEALIPTGGSSGQILEWNSSGTAKWVNKTENTDYKVKQTHSTDTKYKPLLIGYAGSTTAGFTPSEVTDQSYVNKGIYVQPSTSSLFTEGNITLVNSAGTDSPALIFQRGTTLSDSTLDWKIYNTSAQLWFDRSISGGNPTWENILKLDPTNNKMYFKGNEIKITDTTYSAGSGLSLSGTTFNHSNSITAETSFVFKKIKYDAQGHITAVDAITKADIPALDYLPLSGGTLTGRVTTTKPINDIITGTGTAAQDKGSGVSPRYFPARWTYNTGMTATNGDIITIKTPNGGHDYGVFISIDNGTTYYPISTASTSRLSTHFGTNTYLSLIFRSDGQTNNVFPVAGGDSRVNVSGGCWYVINFYDSNTYDRTYMQTRIYAGGVGTFQYSLCAINNNQRMESFTTTSGTGTSKAFNTTAKFLYPPVIMYHSSGSNISNGSVISVSTLYEQYPSLDLRYSCNITSSAGFTKYKPVYLECIINSDNTFSPTSNGLTQTLTSGKYYILLGCMYNDSIYQLTLFAQHPVYYYDGTTLSQIQFTAAEKTKLAGIAEGATKVESSATNGKIKINNVDTTVYTHPSGFTAKTTAGFYKYTVDGNGHVSAGAALAKADITALGIPGENTDTLVQQSLTTTTNFRPLLFGATSSTNVSDLGADITNKSYVSTNFYVKPSTGALYVSDYYVTAKEHGYYLKDVANSPYCGLYDNGQNLWLGAKGSDGYHHNGKTFISTGWSGTLPTSAGSLGGYSTAYISVPVYTVASGETTGTWTHSKYEILHAGNFTTTGSGNAITGVSFTNEKLTFTKGSTFLTSHQTVTDSNPSLTWGSQSTVATIGSTAIHVTMPVNPVPSNNVTGSGTSGYLTKWNGTNTITNGPQLGSSTTTFLRNDGTWATPSGTSYSAGTGLSLSGTTFNHSNSITEETSTVFKKFKYDAQGHITGVAAVAKGDIPQLDYLPLSGGTLTGRVTTKKALNYILTGTGTAGADKGSGQNPRYVPAKWIFDTNQTPSDGDVIFVRNPVAGHDYGVYISIDNGTTFYPATIRDTNRLTTHYGGAGNYTAFIFRSDGSATSMIPLAGNTDGTRVTVTGGTWQGIDYYDSGNTYDRTSMQTRIYAGGVGVFRYSICAMNNNQRMEAFTTTGDANGSPTTTKAFNTTAKFMYPPVIMYQSQNATYTNGDVIGNNYLYEQFANIDLRYSCNITSSAGFTQYKPVYLECILNSDDTFSITTNGLTQTFVPGKYYILLGCMYNTSVYQLALFAQHPMFYYDGTNLCGLPQFSPEDKTKLDGIAAGATKVEQSSTNGSIKINGSDTVVYAHPTYSRSDTTSSVTPTHGGTFTAIDSVTTTNGHITAVNVKTVTLPTDSDTKNTAGSTDTSSKIFLVGATSQATNPQTYSHDTVYVGTDGHVYSNSKQVVNLSDSQALTNKTYNGYTLAAACAKAVVTSIDTSDSLPTSNAVKTFVEGKGYVTTDTKNTAGSTDTSSKIFLIGATAQTANPQTYSDNEVYATSGVLTTKKVQVGGGSCTMEYNSTTQSLDFVFT